MTAVETRNRLSSNLSTSPRNSSLEVRFTLSTTFGDEMPEFQHSPSAQPFEPEDSDTPMPVDLSVLSGEPATPVVEQEEATIVAKPRKKSQSTSKSATKETATKVAATEEPSKHAAVEPVSTLRKDEDYVCDSAFEHVPAQSRKVLMDEPPSATVDLVDGQHTGKAEVVQSVGASDGLSEREKQIIEECWKEVRAKEDGTGAEAEALDVAAAQQHEDNAADAAAKPTGGRFGFLSRGQGKDAAAKKGEVSGAGSEKAGKAGNVMGYVIPKTFDDMARMNSRLVGADEAWINVVLKSFDDLILSVVIGDDARLQCEVAILSMRANKTCSKPNLKDFKVCMMTSLRALVPGRWNSEHEGAWVHLWALVEERATHVMPLPAKYGNAVEDFVSHLSAEKKRDIGMAVFNRMFKEWPKSEMFFKQSNSRLCFLVGRAVELAAQAYREPDACVNELLALGLKHIMYRVPTEYFEPFSSIIAEEVEARCDDPLAAEGLCWALDLVAYTMVRAINEGTSPILRAIAENNPKAIRKALGGAARGGRAEMALKI